MIKTRLATRKDHAFIRKAHHLAYREMVERQFGAWNEKQQDGFVDQDLSTDQYEIVLYHSEPCGYFSLHVDSNRISVIDFAIVPTYQSQGIGSAVLDQLKQRARQAGLSVSLGAFKTNESAQRFYEKHGLVRKGETDLHVVYEWVPDP